METESRGDDRFRPMSSIEKKLKATRKVVVHTRIGETIVELPDNRARMPSCDRHAGLDTPYEIVPQYGDKEVEVVDFEQRGKAISEAERLWKENGSLAARTLLIDVYHGRNDFDLAFIPDDVDSEGRRVSKGFLSDLKVRAGIAAGASPLRAETRVFLSENKVPLTLAIATTLSLIYFCGMAYYYFGR